MADLISSASASGSIARADSRSQPVFAMMPRTSSTALSSLPSALPFSRPSSLPSALPFSRPSSLPSALPFSRPSSRPMPFQWSLNSSLMFMWNALTPLIMCSSPGPKLKASLRSGSLASGSMPP